MNTLDYEQMEIVAGGGLSLKEAAACVISTGLWTKAMVGFALTGAGGAVVAIGATAIALGCILSS